MDIHAIVAEHAIGVIINVANTDFLIGGYAKSGPSSVTQLGSMVFEQFDL